jgi:hypothetical protein
MLPDLLTNFLAENVNKNATNNNKKFRQKIVTLFELNVNKQKANGVEKNKIEKS